MNDKKLKTLFSIVEKMNKKDKANKTKDNSSKFDNLAVYTYTKYKREGGKLSKPTFLKYRTIQILDNEKEKIQTLAFLSDIYNAGFKIKDTSIIIHKGLTGLTIKDKKRLLGQLDYKKLWIRIEQISKKTFICLYDYDIYYWEKSFEKIIQMGKYKGFEGYLTWEAFLKQDKNKDIEFKNKQEFDSFIIQDIKAKGLCNSYTVDLKPLKEPIKIELTC